MAGAATVATFFDRQHVTLFGGHRAALGGGVERLSPGVCSAMTCFLGHQAAPGATSASGLIQPSFDHPANCSTDHSYGDDHRGRIPAPHLSRRQATQTRSRPSRNARRRPVTTATSRRHQHLHGSAIAAACGQSPSPKTARALVPQPPKANWPAGNRPYLHQQFKPQQCAPME